MALEKCASYAKKGPKNNGYSPCRNKPVITLSDMDSWFGGTPRDKQGLCREHALMRITSEQKRATLRLVKLANAV